MAPQREKTMMENGELPTMEKNEEEESLQSRIKIQDLKNQYQDSRLKIQE